MPISAPDLLASLGFDQGKVEIDGPQSLILSRKTRAAKNKLIDSSFSLDHWADYVNFPLSPMNGETIKTNKPHNHETRKQDSE